jgi:lipopolysaccharide/colanic/teichoic acid biosynthesis glycosyltransferase
MDAAGLDPDAALGVDMPGSHTGVRSESVSYGGSTGSTHGVRNGSQKHEAALQTVVSNGNGAGAIALPRPGTLGEIAHPVEGYDLAHGLLARVAKRTFDLVGAVLMMALFSPLLLMIALLIKADSPGPILFRQWRIGKDGKPFLMLKFRTMVDGADAHKPALLHLNEAADGLFKIGTDPRVTRVGRWMRSTCLDELPQLLHVITGKMSLVGPRPLVPEEDVRITGRGRERLSMRPGMTGVWQVGGASAVPIDEMVVLDRGYVENWSPWLDVKLLGETAALVILRKGL